LVVVVLFFLNIKITNRDYWVGDYRCYGKLRIVDWWLFSDVSGQPPRNVCPLKIGLTETSVNIYISRQHNIPEEGRSDLQGGRSLKSFIMLRNHNTYLI